MVHRQDIFHTWNGNQVTCFGFLNFTTFQTKEPKSFVTRKFLVGAIKFRKGNLVTNFNSTTEDTTDTDTTNEVIVVQSEYLELQRLIWINLLELGYGQ